MKGCYEALLIKEVLASAVVKNRYAMRTCVGFH